MEIDDPNAENQIKTYVGMAVAVLFLCLILLSVYQRVKLTRFLTPQDLEMNSLKQIKVGQTKNIKLNECTNSKFGASFLCYFGWMDNDVSPNSSFYEINDMPKVTFKIVKFDIDIIYIQQLSKDRLTAIGQYAPNFVIDETELAGFKAIKVKAFAKDNPQKRLLDYYFVRNKKVLYALMFAVTPETHWDNYRFIFQEIVDSFAFIRPLP